ncbi:MAG: glycosyltransferase family 2 protein [Ignavibacteria bacterium]|nr:glycosyltransferase family 2 protein [Ignavibacteria bacterium]
MTTAATEPQVHIILVNWNGREVTLDCLESLRNISYGNYTVVLVDNGSTDGTTAAVRERFPQTVIIENAENLRFAGGNNVGVRYALDAGAHHVLLLNNDTIVDPDFLLHMVRRVTADPSTGMVVPKIYYHDAPERIWFAGGEVSFWTGTMRHRGIREIDRGQYDAPCTTDYATGCCVLVPAEVVRNVGMLDESYYIYTEDADWSLRIRRRGFTIRYEPAAKVWHRLSVSSGGHLSWFKMKNKFLSNMRFFARYGSWYHWLVFPWASILVNGVAAFRFLLQRFSLRKSNA